MTELSLSSRRQLLAGLGATAGAITLGTAIPASAVPARLPAQVHPRVLDPLTEGLRYLAVDPAAFHGKTAGDIRYVDDLTGVGLSSHPGALLAPLALPVGATLNVMEVAYIAGATGATIALRRRPLNGGAVQDVVTVPLPAGAGTLTAEATPLATIEDAFAYDLQVLLTQPGQTIVGVRLGYVAPATFIPFTPSARVLDTRTSGAKLQPNEERVVNVGVLPTSAAVFNLTVTDTDPGGGFVAVFPANIAWPGNSSVNWSTAGQNVANLVVSAVDLAGAVRIRGGNSATHVVIDVLGELL